MNIAKSSESGESEREREKVVRVSCDSVDSLLQDLDDVLVRQYMLLAHVLWTVLHRRPPHQRTGTTHGTVYTHIMSGIAVSLIQGLRSENNELLSLITESLIQVFHCENNELLALITESLIQVLRSENNELHPIWSFIL